MTDKPKFTDEISFSNGNFTDLGLHKTQSGVLPLVFIKGDEVHPLGTCFAITNDGLCMTAKHVLTQPMTVEFEETGEMDTQKQGGFGAVYLAEDLIGDTPDGIMGGMLLASKVHFLDTLDIALVKLTLPVNRETNQFLPFPAFSLRLSPPGVGERIMGVGYRAMKWEAGPTKVFNVDQRYSATQGEIDDLHLGGRDAAMLPFPCFRTSARFDGGMSGGPIIDLAGRVLGVICSSFETSQDESYISYGSLMAPAMAMTLDVADKAAGNERKAFLWELAQGGAMKVDSRGVEIVTEGNQMRMMVGQSLALNAVLNS